MSEKKLNRLAIKIFIMFMKSYLVHSRKKIKVEEVPQLICSMRFLCADPLLHMHAKQCRKEGWRTLREGGKGDP